MKFIYLNVICLMLSIPAFAVIVHGGGPPSPMPKYRAVSENYFKEKHLKSEGLKDIGISLNGEWSNMDVVRLTYILQEVDKLRPVRDAAIREYSQIRRLVFEKGEVSGYKQDFEHYMNPAAIFGSGISSTTTHQFTLSMNASDEELIAFIAKEIPEKLIKDRAKLENWQKTVARTRIGTWCDHLLEAIGLR